MNLNPEAIRVLCFGDSNTWGYISGSNHERYPVNKRWTGVLQRELGDDFEVIEEGLNSRTIESDDKRPGREGRSATLYAIPCLDSHDPLDFIVVMLGSNELKHAYNMSAQNIADNMKKFLLLVKNRKSQFRTIQPKLIFVALPLLNENTEYGRKNNKYLGATEKSKQLSSLYEEKAKNLEVLFFDASKITETGVDGAHITEDSHLKLGKALAELIKT